MTVATTRERILALLKAHSGQKFTYAEFTQSIKMNPETIGRQLRKMAEEGKIRSDGRGKFWYRLKDEETAPLTAWIR